ncbi:cryptochrome/photolyase family protein [Lysinibacillus sp. NPDC093210]|uniref:cryptochrome/photolyase family protein n=1 Tax=Lysinibacillus sp. NPDC093210 TaxID=3364133 RepID=UPI0037F1BFF9
MHKKIIVLFRNDLRLDDHPALWHAANTGAILPLYIQNDQLAEQDSAQNYWTYYSLQNLQITFSNYDIPLILRKGDVISQVLQLALDTQADAVYFNERFSQTERSEDERLAHILRANEIEVKAFYGDTLFHVTSIRNQQNKPYAIFTSFYKRCLQELAQKPLGRPASMQAFPMDVSSLALEQLQLLTGNWYNKFHNYWRPGMDGALDQWELFIEGNLYDYKDKRDYLTKETISKMSPFIAAGNISIRFLWTTCQELIEVEDNAAFGQQVESFLRQLIWREFSIYQLLSYPSFSTLSLRSNFQHFEWEPNSLHLGAWKKGQTGYPLVDAGMRELWETGYMHNRVRMVVASFLVKHLLQPWQEGYSWFEHTLLDFNAANNAMGWQWVSGTGIDSAPYFRIFNPSLQGEKFDIDGTYIKKWVPELAHLPSKYIHAPHTAPAAILEQASITLGDTYPLPIVDHKTARARALERYNAIKKDTGTKEKKC